MNPDNEKNSTNEIKEEDHTSVNETQNQDSAASADAAESSVIQNEVSGVSQVPPKGNDNLNGPAVEVPEKSKKLKTSLVFRRIINVVAILVFIGSLGYLLEIGWSYLQSKLEYDLVEKEVLSKVTPTPVLPTETDSAADPKNTEDQPTPEAETKPSVKELFGYEPYSVDFDELNEKSDYVVGWIDIPGMDISYPLVLGDDNEYFLRHTYSGMFNASGSIFLDQNMKADPDAQPNLLIYGHNQNNGKMFSNLHKLETSSFAMNPNNQLIVVYTPEKINYYRIFSVRVAYYKGNTYATHYSNDGQYAQYIADAVNESMYDFQSDVSADDHIVTLVTCTADTDYRFVVHAVKLDVE